MEVGTRGADGVPAQVVGDGRVVAALVEVGLDGAAAELGQIEVGLGVEAFGDGHGQGPFLLAFQGAEGFAAEGRFAADLADDIVAAAVPVLLVGAVVQDAVADAVEFQVVVARVAVGGDHEELHAVVGPGTGAGVGAIDGAGAVPAYVELKVDFGFGVHDAEADFRFVGEFGPVDRCDVVPRDAGLVEAFLDFGDRRLGGGKGHFGNN